jgi:hypothetical protein
MTPRVYTTVRPAHRATLLQGGGDVVVDEEYQWVTMTSMRGRAREGDPENAKTDEVFT